MSNLRKYIRKYDSTDDLPNIEDGNLANVDGVFYLRDSGVWEVLELDTGSLADDSVTTAKILAANVTAAKIADSILTGSKVAVVADANVIGGIPELFRIEIADTSGDTDVVMTHKVRVLDFWFRSSGIAAHASLDTVQLKNGSNAITNAVAKTATVNSVVRAGTISPTYEEIAAAGTMKITAAKNTNVAGTAYVLAVRVA